MKGFKPLSFSANSAALINPSTIWVSLPVILTLLNPWASFTISHLTDLNDALISGFVGMLALSFGLAFGLGGKDAAAKLIEDFKRKIS